MAPSMPKSVPMLRVGAVNYLNTKPLIEHLPRLAPRIDLVLDVPSQLAMDLAEGRLEIALIPSIEYFRMGAATILPGVSISSFGPVMSVKLCSSTPFERIGRVSVDEGSRTSIALAQILLAELFGITPEMEPLPLHREPAESNADAVLVIGDRAMRIRDGAYPYTLDLGYEWSRWTGLPFVFAFWVVAEGVKVEQELADAFVEAKRLGRPEIASICKHEAERLEIDEIRCRYYLEQVIRHDFGAQELEGLSRFYRLAVERELAPEGGVCVFHGSEPLTQSR